MINHLNAHTPDHDSPVTGYGTHDRIVAFCPDADGLYLRVDHGWGLGMPSERQMITAAKRQNAHAGRWRLDRVELWPDHSATDVFFARA
jgi:hypothetical protein